MAVKMLYFISDEIKGYLFLTFSGNDRLAQKTLSKL
jgi:hypothetical protein